jgi:hypothetical protein
MVRVTVITGNRHWGWRAKRIPDNPPIPIHTIVGLWGAIINGKQVKFKRPISEKRFSKHCFLKESNFLDFWVYECDDEYISKLLNSKNAILTEA